MIDGVTSWHRLSLVGCILLFIKSIFGYKREVTPRHWVWWRHHYIDVIMTTMASQITRLTVVYSTVYSDADQRERQSSASLAFVWGIQRDRWIPRTKDQLRGKCFHLMTSSCDMEMLSPSLVLCEAKPQTTCHRWNSPQMTVDASFYSFC